jgi:hypothetical protein
MVYTIEKENKVHRFTFSLSLAEHIKTYLTGPYEIRRRKFIIGRDLAPGEKSKSGAYAVVGTHKGRTLRITLYQQLAEIFRDDSRKIAEAWLV